MKLKFEYKSKEIEFDIIRRKRKTISIKIEEDGQIIVSAPLRINKEYILQVMHSKANWIITKQDEISKRGSNKIARDIIEGSTFMYLGEEYPLHLIFDVHRKNITVELIKADCNDLRPNKLLIDKCQYTTNNKLIDKLQNVFLNKADLNNKFIIRTNTFEEEKIKFALEKWYRAETLKIVTRRIDYYASNFKDIVTDVKVKEQKRRWASCTGKNAILFNWRISMARADVLDYIVVHEMCHMDHRNHSKHFWNRVEEIMPDYKEKHEWLKVNGMNLYL
ncbi:M48 family peptidase [Clostridium beijerinckii]|nr:M48 family peptidase [Clostridium beijerinckii]